MGRISTAAITRLLTVKSMAEAHPFAI